MNILAETVWIKVMLSLFGSTRNKSSTRAWSLVISSGSVDHLRQMAWLNRANAFITGLLQQCPGGSARVWQLQSILNCAAWVVANLSNSRVFLAICETRYTGSWEDHPHRTNIDELCSPRVHEGTLLSHLRPIRSSIPTFCRGLDGPALSYINAGKPCLLIQWAITLINNS